MLLIDFFATLGAVQVSFERIQGQGNGMIDLPPVDSRGQIPRDPHGTLQYASPRPAPGIFAVTFPQSVYCDLCQLRDAPYVAQPDSGDVTKLLLDGRHSLFEPDWSDGISVAVHGSDADR